MEDMGMATFTYDLGQNWKLVQTVVEVQGKGVQEAMVFTNGETCITLLDHSCQKLRNLFKQINK